MNRMYVVETNPTVTGFKAEHRLALKPSRMQELLLPQSDACLPADAPEPLQVSQVISRVTSISRLHPKRAS